MRTLVLDLDNTLVHSDWTRGRGWRTFKRPGVDDFLKQMAQMYEIVVYTAALPTYADPILDRLDPNGCIAYRWGWVTGEDGLWAPRRVVQGCPGIVLQSMQSDCARVPAWT